ncbi:GtrA family protein [Lentisphaera marina]|uniref:GtrA family protein n=1 Tax=Lentisphaera marina TaxID=1111041 RepID=UPI003B67DDCC
MIIRQFSKFIIVGAIGFLIDATILQIFLKFLGPYYARLLSFFIAVLGTWSLNRLYVFKKKKNTRNEACAYLSVQSTGFVINLAIYSFFIYKELLPFFALAIASASALIWNFLGAKYLVFKEGK